LIEKHAHRAAVFRLAKNTAVGVCLPIIGIALVSNLTDAAATHVARCLSPIDTGARVAGLGEVAPGGVQPRSCGLVQKVGEGDYDGDPDWNRDPR
jgi:hypothetical protein